VSLVLASQARIAFSGEDCILSYLPLAHSFDRILEELALCVGAHIGYWRVGGAPVQRA
jgi:long-subunit acyl-CoA synthetase (AMP-forming)